VQGLDVPHQKELVLMSSALKDNGSTARWRKIRQRILERDQYTCQACGLEGNTVDHIIARSLGGGDDEFNLQCLCTACNSAKGGINRQNGKNGNKGGFFNNTPTPLTLPVLNSPQNGSRSHEND
jgi:5-methylcytosine-specific restriction endonuclease McrA